MELNKIYNMDCLDGMKLLQDKSVDMILCDLPYGQTKNKWDSVIPLNDYINIKDRNVEKQEYYMIQALNGLTKKEIDIIWKNEKIDGLWTHYERIIKENGVIALFGNGMFTADLMNSNKRMWKYNLVWDKVLPSGFLNANRMPLRQHEDICIFYKKAPKYTPQKIKGKPNHSKGKAKDCSNNNYGEFEFVDNSKELGDMKHPTSILRFSKPHPSKMLHPTEKSVECCEWLIKSFTTEGMVVLDNCIGSGTTAVSCINTNRNYIGYESGEDEFNTAVNRVSQYR